MKIIGIYKITSPSGKIYIGQSINLVDRFRRYKRMACKQQPRLFNSFYKYGVYNHIFEIIENCELLELNNRERYWQEFYDVLNQDKGLNCSYVNTDELPQIMTEQTKDKIRKKAIGRLHSEQTIKLYQETRKGENNAMFGKTHSKETIENLKNKIITKETRNKMSISGKNKPKIYKIILNIETGIFYNGIIEAAIAHNIGHSSLKSMLNGQRKNKTNLIYTYEF